MDKAIIVINIVDDDNQITRKLFLTQKEILTLRSIYDNMTLKNGIVDEDFYVKSSMYKDLMRRGLLEFSAFYRSVVLTEVSKIVIGSKKDSGSFVLENEEGEMKVNWKGF